MAQGQRETRISAEISVSIGADAMKFTTTLDEVLYLRSDNERLRASLMRLANEVAATTSLAELAIRESAGNTNYQCLIDAVSDARVAMTTDQQK